jgi:hypothetical protein
LTDAEREALEEALADRVEAEALMARIAPPEER